MARDGRPRLTAAVVVLALATLAIAGCTGSAPTPSPSTAASPAPRVAPSVTSSPSSSGPPFHYDASPFPTTQHPVRRTVSQAVNTLQDLIQGYPDSSRRFAGSWIADDGQSLGVAVAAKYWAGTARHLVAVMHRTHPDAPFHVVRVRYSEAELDALQHEVFTYVYGDSTSGSVPGDVTLAGVGTVVQQNRLNAQLVPGHDDVAYEIRARFGSWIIITDDGSVPTAV